MASSPTGQLCWGAVPHICLLSAWLPCCSILSRTLHSRHHHLQPLLHRLRWWDETRTTLNHVVFTCMIIEAPEVQHNVVVFLFIWTAKVVPEEITPLVPAVAGEKASDDPTCYILETLLKYMVIQVTTNFNITTCSVYFMLVLLLNDTLLWSNVNYRMLKWKQVNVRATFIQKNVVSVLISLHRKSFEK